LTAAELDPRLSSIVSALPQYPIPRALTICANDGAVVSRWSPPC
jgi:hypothetical protein